MLGSTVFDYLNMRDLELLDADFIGTDSVDIAIASGNRNVDSLTDIEFQRRHPERSGKKIQKGDTASAREWIQIRDEVVRPALARAALNPAPAASSTALAVRPPAPLAAPAQQGGWTFFRVLKYGFGGLAALLLGAWTVRHRGGLALEARTATRHAGQLARRARASLASLGSEHRTLRERMADERQAALTERRVRKLKDELEVADQKVSEATRQAEQKARQLQALQNLRRGA